MTHHPHRPYPRWQAFGSADERVALALVASAFGGWQRTPCEPATLDVVAMSIAVVHAELLLIHPFRDGNGRLARWLADLMAAQAGYPVPAYGFSGRGSKKRRADYLLAVQQGYLENYLPLVRFFAEAILRRERDAEG